MSIRFSEYGIRPGWGKFVIYLSKIVNEFYLVIDELLHGATILHAVVGLELAQDRAKELVSHPAQGNLIRFESSRDVLTNPGEIRVVGGSG